MKDMARCDAGRPEGHMIIIIVITVVDVGRCALFGDVANGMVYFLIGYVKLMVDSACGQGMQSIGVDHY